MKLLAFLFLLPCVALAQIGTGPSVRQTNSSATGLTLLGSTITPSGGSISSSGFAGNGGGLTNVNGEFIVTSYGALGGTNNDTAVFNALLGIPGATVVIPYRTNGFTVGNLHVTNSVTFINRGSVLFFATNATGVCVDMHDNTNIVLHVLRIDCQNVSNYVSLLPSSVVTRPYPETYLSYSRSGIRVNMEANSVYACKISNVSGPGFSGHNQHGGSSESFPLTAFVGNNVLDSTMGFDFNAFTNAATAEYSSIYGLNASGCMYGIKIGAGNIRVIGSTFSGNGMGHLIQGGTNPQNGQFVGCTFNHNAFPIYGEGAARGTIYDGCYFSANTGPIYLNGVAGFQIRNSQLGDRPWIFITNSTSVFVPSVVVQNNSYLGLWANNRITNASTSEFVHYGNVSIDRAADNDNPWLFTAINTGDFNPQFGWGNTVSNANSGVYYYQGRRSDGLTYMVGAQGDTATGLVLQHTRGAGNLGTTFASILGDQGFVSRLSDIETNTAPNTVITNDIVVGAKTTARGQRFSIALSVFGTATLTVPVDGSLVVSNASDGKILTQKFSVPAGVLAVYTITNELCIPDAGPSSIYWVTNCSVVPNTTIITYK